MVTEQEIKEDIEKKATKIKEELICNNCKNKYDFNMICCNCKAEYPIQEAIIKGYQTAKQEFIEDEIKFINKIRERLSGYSCGYHKELDRMLANRIKEKSLGASND